MNSKLDWLYVIKRKFDLRFYARFQYIRTPTKKILIAQPLQIRAAV